MGYDTDFEGQVEVDPPLTAEHVQELIDFADERHGGGADVYTGFPGFWCKWEPIPDGTAIEWNGCEKFCGSSSKTTMSKSKGQRSAMTTSEHQSIWLQALRSGEYKQAYGALRKSDGYCCLGVACDLYMKHTGEGSWDEDGNFCVGGIKEDANLLPVVKDWLGLDDVSGSYTEVYEEKGSPDGGDTYTTSLAELNDSEVPFSKIADKIAEGPTDLFKRA